jgi:hypothetical protein
MSVHNVAAQNFLSSSLRSLVHSTSPETRIYAGQINQTGNNVDYCCLFFNDDRIVCSCPQFRCNLHEIKGSIAFGRSSWEVDTIGETLFLTSRLVVASGLEKKNFPN